MVEDKSKILIIDDEEVVLDSCTQILEGGPYQVATAMDGTFGLELVQEFHPDVVFVDLKMPGIQGFEVLDRIHSFDPTIVAIVITGYATVNSAVEAIKKGAYDFLPKPFTPDEFRVITRRGLERRKLVTETTALRREREMLRDQFAAILSHELKSPISAVQQNLFALESQLSDQLDEEQSNRITRMKSSIDDLLKLIHTWLRVVSADADIQKIQEDFQPTSIESVITKAIEGVQTQSTRKDIEIQIKIEETLRPTHGDEITLVEALVNLLSNAIKYSRMGSKIFVTAEDKDDEILISVADRGVGISEEDLPFIFGDFYVGEASPDGERGSGLGLGITKRIVEAHNGSISVDSALGKGSTFVIHLPLVTPNR
ncbi:MAG: hybrid sensor histidine kinase/response regulator [Anaerolineaceae bacterium]|nr:MAG: hybrid sensor histidine kinase/response regulator [Anaerolineaceae bacterium]